MPSESYIEFRKAREIGEILTASLTFCKDEFVPLFKSLLFIAGPFLLVTSAFAAWYQSEFLSVMPDLSNPEAFDELFDTIFSPTYWVVMLSSFVGYFMLLAAAYGYLMLYVDREEGQIEVRDVWEALGETFWVVLTTSLGLGLMVLVISLINIIPCLGQLAFVAGLVYVVVVLSIIYVVRLREGIGFFEAVQRSRSLMAGYFWPTFGLLFITAVIYVSLSVVFALPASIIGFMAGLNALEGDTLPLWIHALSTLFSALGSLLVVIPIVAVTMQYFNLVERREAPSLDERIARINRPESSEDDAV